MCGICGIYRRDGTPISRPLLEKMTRVIAHRGPDGEGFFWGNEIGLGHRRLSIIDLDGGAQPIANEDGSIQLIFNGEIYNYIELREELLKKGHIFKTQSDTEVILHGYEEWGRDCVSKFNGIFAFALWDTSSRQLFLARDHLGVKPLYYVDLGNRFLFGSEIKALLQDPGVPREVDLSALSQYFTLRFVPSPDTLFRGIKKLPPAHWMTVGVGGTRIGQFWNWTPHLRTRVVEAELVEQYQALVEDAVHLQMRSDVPVGLFLSSGVDSGSLLALMTKETGRPVHTFTIGFEQGESSNETSDARELATRFGADHIEMMVSPEDYTNYFERYLWDLEEPVGNETAAAFYFVSRIASRMVKVALSGQGADEPWAGYDRYIGIQLSELYSKLPSFLTEGVLSRLVNRYARDERLRRGVLSLGERDLLTRFVKVYSFFSAGMKRQLFQPWVKGLVSTEGEEARKALLRLQEKVTGLDPLTQILYIDTRANLPDDLLMVGDKTAMANSLEARVPFLDFRIVEFIETLPPNLKLRFFRGKFLHKKAIEKWLPKNVIYREKKGFESPIERWLRGRMRQYMNECLLSESSAVNQFFERGFIRRLISAHEGGTHNYLRQIHLLIAFELWHQQFITNFPRPETSFAMNERIQVSENALEGAKQPKRKEPRYLVISPMRDEADNVERMIGAMLRQTILPIEWIVVDDGSTDSTGGILEEHAKHLPWLRVVHRDNRGFRQPGGGVVAAFEDGYRTIQAHDWDFIVKLDGDLSFDANYFESCLQRFDNNPKLGVGGGTIQNVYPDRIEIEKVPDFHVRGATKIYRRECWEQLGGLLKAPGWDTLDEVKANMLGWQSGSFSDILITQHRVTGGAEGPWRDSFKNGRANYICGYHPLFMLLKCLKRTFQSPYILGSLALFSGYVSGYLGGKPQVNDPALIKYLREQQVRRLTFSESIWK